jgi:hypothetical protein
MNNVLQLPTELSHFQTSVLQDRIAAVPLLRILRLLHFPVKQNTQAALHVMGQMAVAALAQHSQGVRLIILLAD